jgi:uncharacterized protein
MVQTSPPSFTAFLGPNRLASGPLAEVAIAVMKASSIAAAPPIIIFDDANGRPIDLDLRGTEREIVARLPQPAPDSEATADEAAALEPRGRGRPKLGVVAREVTLLPRHWDWLATQPGGASVALRKLVEEARRTSGDRDRSRTARDAAYHFMSTMAGNLPAFEEASRALFAGDRLRFEQHTVAWPEDIRAYAIGKAFGFTEERQSD